MMKQILSLFVMMSFINSFTLNDGLDRKKLVYQNLRPIKKLRVGSMVTSIAAKEGIKDIDQLILQISKKHHISAKWVTAVIWTESHFKKNITSNIGAVGLMQITRPTGAFICKEVLKQKRCEHFKNYKVFKRYFSQEEINITYGVAYLKYLMKKFDNNLKLATLAYNEGPTRVSKLKEKIVKEEIFKDHQYYVKISKRMGYIAAL